MQTRHCNWCYLLLLQIIQSCLAFSAHSIESTESTPNTYVRHLEVDEAQVLRQLFQKDYFKYSSCREVSDYVLNQIGLPSIQSAKPILSGKRGSFDRSREHETAPTIQDSIFPISNNLINKIEIQTEPVSSKKWKLTLQQIFNAEKKSKQKELKTEPAESKTKSIFTFDIEQHRSRETCELTSYTFTATSTNTSKTAEPSTISLTDCIRFFVLSAKTAKQKLEPASQTIVQTLKRDCSIFLRFSKEAKERALTLNTPNRSN